MSNEFGRTMRCWDIDANSWMGKSPSGANHRIDMMPSSGLFDKTGREVYDGDILLFPNGGTVLIWESVHCWGYMQCLGPEVNSLSSECEIIGNKYENPDMLPPDYKWPKIGEPKQKEVSSSWFKRLFS